MLRSDRGTRRSCSSRSPTQPMACGAAIDTSDQGPVTCPRRRFLHSTLMAAHTRSACHTPRLAAAQWGATKRMNHYVHDHGCTVHPFGNQGARVVRSGRSSITLRSAFRFLQRGRRHLPKPASSNLGTSTALKAGFSKLPNRPAI
jgi:hypothetical protein